MDAIRSNNKKKFSTVIKIGASVPVEQYRLSHTLIRPNSIDSKHLCDANFL